MKWATPSSLWNPASTPRAEGFSEDGPSPKREESTSVSRPHRAFAFVSARIFAGSLAGPFHRRLRRIRCLLCRFDCYWASHPSQAGLPPAEIHTHSRRTDTYLNSGDAQTSLPAILGARSHPTLVTYGQPRVIARRNAASSGPAAGDRTRSFRCFSSTTDSIVSTRSRGTSPKRASRNAAMFSCAFSRTKQTRPFLPGSLNCLG